jgi:hypothetical protein
MNSNDGFSGSLNVTELFNQLKEGLLSLDPVYFCENNLTLDGEPFRLHGNGYKPFADIYRYIGLKALEPDGKPVIIVKGRQVGATTMAAAIELYFMACGLFGTMNRSPMRVMHCFPLLDLAYTYTKTKLNPMIAAAIPDEKSLKGARTKSRIETKIDNSIGTADSLKLKQFTYGNQILIESTGLTADRLRGRTVDYVLYDEAQDITSTAMANANKTLSQARYGPPGSGAQVLFGTPKAKGSDFHNIWRNSSQQYYFLGCESCDGHFPLYTPESNDWETIWIEDDFPADYVDPKTKLKPHGFIVKCTHCGHEQDKRPAAERGKWVALKKDHEDSKYVGYHINQLYMPHLSRDKILGEKPENNPINTERAYQNECLGEFFAGDAAPITPDELETLCGDAKRTFRRSISPEEGKKVYVGADWGQKVDIDQLAVGDRVKRQRGQSYSSVVVLTVDGPGILSVEYAKLLKRNDLEFKRAFIDETFRRYSVSMGVGDIGYANDLTELLQRDYGDRFIASRAVGTVKHHAKFSRDTFPTEIAFERDFYIAELYDMMKRGKIRFPYGSYEQIGWLIQHCCSMEIKPTIDRGGGVGIRYVKGSTPNDGFMALLNAYLAYKFDITNGFSIFNPNHMRENPNKPGPPMALASYLPGLNPWKR